MTLPLRRLTDPVYRAHHPMWAFDPESGDGAKLRGGRFNRPGTAALYTSLSVETAWLEAQQGFAFKAQPLTICSYAVDCADILDLTEAAARDAAGVTAAELGSAWEDLAGRGVPVPTWALADRLQQAGCVGLVVTSFAARATAADVNAVFWRWTREPPHRVKVIDDERRLPRDRRSWEI